MSRQKIDPKIDPEIGGASDKDGMFGAYGGRYVPETLMPALDELAEGWEQARHDPRFLAGLDGLSRNWAGRPTPLTLADRFGPDKRLHWKREDLLHHGAQ